MDIISRVTNGQCTAISFGSVRVDMRQYPYVLDNIVLMNTYLLS